VRAKGANASARVRVVVRLRALGVRWVDDGASGGE